MGGAATRKRGDLSLGVFNSLYNLSFVWYLVPSFPPFFLSQGISILRIQVYETTSPLGSLTQVVVVAN